MSSPPPTLFEKRKHRRNRSLTDDPALSPPQPTIIVRHVTYDTSPSWTPTQFIPSRHAPAPPQSKPSIPPAPPPPPVLTHSISTPASSRRAGRLDSLALRSESVSTTPVDPSSLKKQQQQQQHHKSGFGKFFKKLGSKSDHPPLPPPCSASKIPLAEPPSPLPSKSMPSIEVVGRRTYRKVDLCAALEESDHLLSTIPAELRARPPNAQQQQQSRRRHRPSTYHNRRLPPSPAFRDNNNNNNNTTINATTTATTNTTATTTTTAKSHAEHLGNNDNYNHNYNRTTSSLKAFVPEKETLLDGPYHHQQQQQSSDDDGSSSQSSPSLLERLSTRSYSSTLKSSGCSSLYSTFGPGSSDSTLELDEKSGLSLSSRHYKRLPDTPVPRPKVNDAVPSGDDNDDDDDVSSDSDNEVFVDASGWSQEDIEREKKRLSKRLSIGHFGSAGGLILSITPAPEYKPKESLDKPIAEEEENENMIEEKTSCDDDNDIERDALEAAKRLWEVDESFVLKEKAAEWLGQRKSFNAKALVYYMDYLECTDMRLDDAFRKLCTRLYFKAETQQIDRILEAFARRFWECNPKSIFGNADSVYAVAYSLLLLNTDLHVVQGSHVRMTRSAFVRNTISTIKEQSPESRHVFSKTWENDMEVYLKELYSSVKYKQILQPVSSSLQTTSVAAAIAGNIGSTSVAEKRTSLLGGKKVVDFRRSVNSMITRKSSSSTTTRQNSIFSMDDHPTTPVTSLSPTSLASSPSRFSFDTLTTTTMTPACPSPTRKPAQQRDPPLLADGDPYRPPYFQEGYLIRKHLLETGSQKARHRDWKECFVVVGQGELKMFGITSGSSSTSTSSSHTLLMDSLAAGGSGAGCGSLSGGPGAGGNSSNSNTSSTKNKRGSKIFFERLGGSTMPLLGTICLNHSLSNILPPPGYNRQRPHVFAIQQPSGGVYLFQTTSPEHLSDWVSTCNYWAARQSKDPLPGGVSNMEYGWGACLDDVILDLDGGDGCGNYLDDPDAVCIYDWRPPAPPTVSSTLGEQEQIDALRKHLNALAAEINEHRELKRKILVKFTSKSANHDKVLSNWETRSTYLLHEIIKYQNYCDALEKSARQRRQELQPILLSVPFDYESEPSDLLGEIEKELSPTG